MFFQIQMFKKFFILKKRSILSRGGMILNVWMPFQGKIFFKAKVKFLFKKGIKMVRFTKPKFQVRIWVHQPTNATAN